VTLPKAVSWYAIETPGSVGAAMQEMVEGL
jgi:hypothetical protein